MPGYGPGGAALYLGVAGGESGDDSHLCLKSARGILLVFVPVPVTVDAFIYWLMAQTGGSGDSRQERVNQLGMFEVG